MSKENNDEKIDKDLTLQFDTKFEIIWEVQPNEDIATRLLYAKSPETEFVFFQACASEIRRLIDTDKELPKDKRMKPNQRTQFANAALVCQTIASRVGLKIYEKQINLPDNRIITLGEAAKNIIH